MDKCLHGLADISVSKDRLVFTAMVKLSKTHSVCLLSVALAAAIIFISRGSSPGLPAPHPVAPILIKREIERPLEKHEEVKTLLEPEEQSVQSPEEESVDTPEEKLAIFSREEKLRRKASEIHSIELENPAKSFSAGEILSGAFIKTYLEGVYKGVIHADQDYNLTLSFRNGDVIEDRFMGEIFVEISEVSSSRKTSFWNHANRRVRVVTEAGKESILIAFPARNLPVPDRMLQLVLIEGDDGIIVGNLYEMKDEAYVRVGFFRLKSELSSIHTPAQ